LNIEESEAKKNLINLYGCFVTKFLKKTPQCFFLLNLET
jgi:hypothetical protein